MPRKRGYGRGTRGVLPEYLIVDKNRHQLALKKRKAQYMLSAFDLNKSQCDKCGSNDRLERHHPDYDKPLKFITLCHLCHMGRHAAMRALASGVPSVLRSLHAC